MIEAEPQVWHPATFVEHVRTLDRQEYIESFGAGLFLLVTVSGAADPVLAALASNSKLLDRMRLRRSVAQSTTGVHTHSQLGDNNPASDAIVPAGLSEEPRFIVLVESFEEDAEKVTVGRGHDADVLLRHPSVSKHHAHFLLDQVGAVGLEDLGSKNGTFVNDTRITSRIELKAGDALRFGSVRTLIVDGIALWPILTN